MKTLHTRRQFLRRTALGGSLACTVPAFLAGTFDRLQAEADQGGVAAVTGRDAPILVVIQLAGGNDGLNTVVPYTNDDYRRARPRLAVSAADVLKLNADLGLHPALTGFKALFDAGQLGIIQAVGYPNPNRSHFRSTEILATAADADRTLPQGWIGRYFDHACAGAEPTVGLAVGRQLPQAFAARSGKGVALENPGAFRYFDGDDPEAGEMAGGGQYYRAMQTREDPTLTIGKTGGSIGALPGKAASNVDPLEFLERTALAAQVSSDAIQKLADRAKNRATYPNGRLGEALKLVARLITGGLGTRVYYASQGGYDTHTNQAGNHDRLLRELGDSLQAFVKDLQEQGQLDRVLIMTFSEFGRRVAENASGGTDHGAGAPLFICGSRIRPGVHGVAPALSAKDLVNGDVRFATDFRQVYATVLDRWLGTTSEKILGRRFEPLSFV